MSYKDLIGDNKKKKSGKPTIGKFPNIPKSTNLSVLNNYAKRCEKIKKKYLEKLAEYNKKMKIKADAKAKVTAMKKQIAKIKKGGK